MGVRAQKLFEMLETSEIVTHIESGNPEISGIEIDSRNIKINHAFIAMKGLQTDGHQYINQAIQAGAKMIFCEELPEIQDGITYVQLADLRRSIGRVVNQFYGNVSGAIHVIGVTGTNGKSTVVTILYQLFCELGYKVGLISTVENRIGDEVYKSSHTTPDVVSVAKLIAEMREQGCSFVFMEVSSHGLDQGRVVGVPFKGAVFTNITHDHLDYHGNMLNYINAKKIFFDELAPQSFALVNVDDRNGKVMLQNCKGVLKTYGIRTMADYRVKILQDSILGLHLKMNDRDVFCQLSGEFNAYNLCAVFGVATLLGEREDEVLRILSGVKGAEGRMEKVISQASNKIGIVDYAHTPDALKNVIETINNTKDKNTNLITVLGCGGDRDKSKRPKMAVLATSLSDKTILTSDNPRSENPESILDDMEYGLTNDLKNRMVRITDRQSAIKTAVMMAGENDIILVAGKGHEKYQEINGVKHPFSDKKILLQALGG